MQRVSQNGDWTLFSPSDVPDLHDKYGSLCIGLLEYERRAEMGEIRQFKRVAALQLWRKMLSMLFETGHPWITFRMPAISAPHNNMLALCIVPTCVQRLR